ncbi:hypothetical protein [Bacillus nakamurai]|uniref:hypothetical protein n=1 Tax=Bacillus nakamurai TaxID=1793963 RepID=UPI001E654A55|nr:hypothetical protein [Bacillus nakamurai]MCC9022910.1 hypothetical protein [Bacillus nakamurai]MCP6681552.1 hypothetical protein [Bacillus nakamurai]
MYDENIGEQMAAFLVNLLIMYLLILFVPLTLYAGRPLITLFFHLHQLACALPYEVQG